VTTLTWSVCECEDRLFVSECGKHAF
jgi:hypothetical protein